MNMTEPNDNIYVLIESSYDHKYGSCIDTYAYCGKIVKWYKQKNGKIKSFVTDTDVHCETKKIDNALYFVNVDYKKNKDSNCYERKIYHLLVNKPISIRCMFTGSAQYDTGDDLKDPIDETQGKKIINEYKKYFQKYDNNVLDRTEINTITNENLIC